MFGRGQLTQVPLRIIFLTTFLVAWTLLLCTSEYALAATVASLPEKTIPSTPALLPIATTYPKEQARGHVVFEHSFFDFGTVTEGDIVKHTFKFKNDGLGKVKIGDTESSCGCTTASAALKEYAAGEAGEMEVVVDTKGKKGIIVKTVTLTLENNAFEKVELSLAMKLEPPPHPPLGDVRNINTEPFCKRCHLESAEGQSGIFLFHRVCSQCHGKKGTGGFGIAFNNAKWQKIEDARIKKVIKAGVADKFMPSFVDGVTPPLTEEQVDSLVQYIRSLVQH
jgi:cytochrome c5